MSKPANIPAAPLRVLFCCNAGFHQHLAVALESLVDSHPGVGVEAHLITGDCGTAEEARLRRSVARHRGLSLLVHHFPLERYRHFFVDKYLTAETYLRIFAAEVLPPDIETIIYLDCDLVVVDDLRPLQATEVGGYALAAAPDLYGELRCGPLGLPDDYIYINAGVLLLNLAWWRRHAVAERLVRFIEERAGALALHDQDAINAVLHDSILLLDHRWNLQAPMFRMKRRDFAGDYEALRRATRHPAIVHYAGADKPWHFRSDSPRKLLYRHYLARTAWRMATPPLPTFCHRLEYQLDRWLLPIGIDLVFLTGKLLRLGHKALVFIARFRTAEKAPVRTGSPERIISSQPVGRP